MQATDQRHDDVHRDERQHAPKVDARPVESCVGKLAARQGDRERRSGEEQPPEQQRRHDAGEPAARHARAALERLRGCGAFEYEDRHREQPACGLPGHQQP